MEFKILDKYGENDEHAENVDSVVKGNQLRIEFDLKNLKRNMICFNMFFDFTKVFSSEKSNFLLTYK